MTGIDHAIDPAIPVLTVNNRLAAELRRRYDRRQADRGLAAWPSAQVLPWAAWLQQQYEQLVDAGACREHLLGPEQERVLWQDVLAQDDPDAALLRPAAAAQLAQQAYQLLHDWRLDAHPLAALGGDDTRRFLDWRERFDTRLRRDRLLSAAGLPDRLLDAVRAGDLPCPRALQLAGFDTLSPGQAELLDALAAAGTRVQHLDPDSLPRAAAARVEAIDRDSEIRLAARWARAWLRRQPDARIAVVCPRLQPLRAQLERLFGATLSPADYLAGRSSVRAFNLSLGEPLDARALTAQALRLLRLLHVGLDHDQLGELLRSPFLGGQAAEWPARAQLDIALREDHRRHHELATLAERVRRIPAASSAHCPDLAGRLDALVAWRRALPRRDSPSHWAAGLQQALQLGGWPGDATLDSAEYQAYERVRSLFSSLARIERVKPRLALGDAIDILQRIAGETVFQPQSPPAAIQVLGPLEAAGIDFDAIWLLAVDDQAWPAPASPNPLLPLRLQRELGLPHSSAARETAFADTITRRLLAATPTLIASHARRDGDQELRPSPLVAGWPLCTATDLGVDDDDGLYAACAVTPALEPLPPALRLPPPATPRGGTALLGAQASCPFKAIARFRLQARAPVEPLSAPGGAMTGTLVHRVMQLLWGELADGTGLAATDGEARQTMARQHAWQALREQARQWPQLFGARFSELEVERLAALACDWLAIEEQRGQDFVVESRELSQRLAIGGLELDARIDRVDRLADGSCAIIDYKTGQAVGTDAWLEQRLTEAQLPAYCIASGLPVSALLFANLSREPRQRGLRGISRDTGFADGVEVGDERIEGGWDALLERWRAGLGQLADEILAGRADPTPSELACRYCEFGDLCRVRDLVAGDDDD
jgi:probable DNA repair protein